MSYVGSRFGQDTPARIAQTADLLLEATEMPTEPRYQALVPFLPTIVAGDGSTTVGSSLLGVDDAQHKQYPDRLDIYVWQGDDIVIPLYFKDPNQPLLDMSTWAWTAQVRTRHAYNARWVYDFVETASLILPDVDAEPPDDVNTTLVNLVLPRQVNRFRGVFLWELASMSPWTGPDLTAIEQPDEVTDDTMWPPTEQVKTWLYGRIYVVPRLTATDSLPLPWNAITNGSILWVTPEGWVAGPNGRVP